MEYNELRHWGIKGMKWGIRRYQNKDGSLTPAGKKRMYGEMYDAESKEAKDRKRYTADAKRWAKEDTERSRKLIDESTQMTNKLKNATDASIRRSKANRPAMDLSKMSDKEMKEQINRALLERQYNDMFAPQKSTRGREYVSHILEIGGAALGITSSALGIALAIKELKG